MNRRSWLGGMLAGSLLCLCMVKPVVAEDKPPEGMVLIPAGEFIMGLEMDAIPGICDRLACMPKHLENASPARKVNLDAFYMDIYEVTNENYKKFVDATKHKVPESWEEEGYPAKKANHPVVWVSWYDAVEYCKWVGKRLPAEEEWEKGARGTDGRLFPWGSDFNKGNLNYQELMLDTTTPVGKYPGGKSPYGLLDMAGNVWEWTASNYLAYPNTKFEDEFFGKERFVYRGGSWFTESYDALSTFRDKSTAESSYEDVGFRCVKNAK